ncbi:MAG: NUDIX hydrolase [Xanthomonadales bacterium]|nr:NUDIX hydrolase [Xanthomonadales bacterium]
MTDRTTNDDTLLYAGRYLRLVERGGWELVSRRHRVAVLVAITPDDALLLVEQFRMPIQRRTIELPAGLVGDQAGQEGEALLAAARRELEEETGWRAGHVDEIMPCPTSAGMTDEMAVFVRATDLERVGDGGGDDSEDIRVHAVARDGIDEWLARRHAEGFAIDPKIYTALYWSPPRG